MTIEDVLKRGWILLYLSDSPTDSNFRAFHGSTNVYAKTLEELVSIIELVTRHIK